jgi:hypothetical protein
MYQAGGWPVARDTVLEENEAVGRHAYDAHVGGDIVRR